MRTIVTVSGIMGWSSEAMLGLLCDVCCCSSLGQKVPGQIGGKDTIKMCSECSQRERERE